MFTRNVARIASRTLCTSRPKLQPKTSSSLPTDEVGMPLEPTWSVKELLESYPAPKLDAATLKHLHKLSALVPPKENTPEFEKLRGDLEEMIRMVEAVKTLDIREADEKQIPDGRIWPEGHSMALDEVPPEDEKSVTGRDLLKHASDTRDDFYVVEAPKRKRCAYESP